MKAHELAQKLLEHPNMTVGIPKFGGDNRWPVTNVEVVDWDCACDSTLLIGSEHCGKFLVIEAEDGRGSE